MIKLYETAGCSSCRKAKSWLEENQLDYRSVNIETKPLKFAEIKFLFSLADDIYDVVSKRSNPVQSFKRTHGYELEDVSFNYLIAFLQKNPTAMKRPLLTNGKVLVSGYDADELTVLLPPEKRGWNARVAL